MNYELEDYFSDLEIAEADETEPVPDKPDFEQMAKQFKLELRETGLVDRDAMKKDPLGSIQMRNFPIGDYLFFLAREKDLYEGEIIGGKSILPDYYLVWFTENENPRVGDFEECKDQVVKFWKQGEAFKLAQEEAESISNKVNDVRKSKMSELYPERALPTGEFSWFDSLRRSGVLSRPGNVDRPSDDFMAKAFSLVELEAGVAVDSSRETVYVIQSISGSSPVNELGADFLQNRLMNTKRMPPQVNRAAGYYTRQEQRKSQLELKESLGFELDSDFLN